MADLSPEQQARIREKLNLKKYANGAAPSANVPNPSPSGKTPEYKALDRAVKDAELGADKGFPTELVSAVVKAIDVVMPEEIEQRTIQIAEMYLNKVPAYRIAEELGIDLNLVRSEIKKIDSARSLTFRENPELAKKVVESHFDVLTDTAKMVAGSFDILEMLKEELNIDHENRKNDPTNGKKGMSPFKLQAYWAGVDAVGRCQDRMAEILGLMRGKGNVEFNQVVNNVTFNNEQLNAIADQFLQATGNTIARPKQNGHAPAEVIVEVPSREVKDE